MRQAQFKAYSGRFVCLLLGAFLGGSSARAVGNPLAQLKSVIFGCHSDNLADFESFAHRAKQSGATHIVLTAEDFPWATWQSKLLDERLHVFEVLVNNCRDAIDYQFDLDSIKDWNLRRPIETQQELTQIPESLATRDTARREINNGAVLIDLLQSQKEPLIDLAKTNDDENIRVLGPDLIDQPART